MKVKCINTGCWKYITISKPYYAIREDGIFYRIIDDNGKEYWFP